MSAAPLSANLTAIATGELPRPARARPLATSLCLACADACAVLTAAALSFVLWTWINPSVTSQNVIPPVASLGLFLTAYLVAGLYDPASFGPVEELRRLVKSTLVVSLLLTAAVFLAKSSELYSRGAFILTGALVSVSVPLARAAVRRAFARQAWWGVPVLVLGAGSAARLIIHKLKAAPELGLKPVACLDDDPVKRGACSGVPVLGPLTLADATARSLGVRHLLVAMPNLEPRRLLAILEACSGSFSRVLVVPNLFGLASLWVTPRDLGGVLCLELRENLLNPGARLLKRSLDVMLAGLLSLLTLPVVAVAALWIRRVSPGPVFYTQERAGAGGATIRLRKLRTMRQDADRILRAYLDSSPEARREWERHMKLRHDPRVLPGLGRWLRRTSLDEVPQLWSVLRGEMSLVGPRPLPAYHLNRFGPDFRALRSKVRPGLTGLWQVAARSEGDLELQRELDTYYIRNWSLWLELYILARTVAAVLTGRGAY